MNVDALPVPKLAAPEPERESAIEATEVGDRFRVADFAGRRVAQVLRRGGAPAC